MDNEKVLLLFARIRSYDPDATLELLEYAQPTIQSLATKWRKGAEKRLFDEELENAGAECVLTIAKKLTQPPDGKWAPPESAKDLKGAIECAIREAKGDAKGTTSRERRRASRFKKRRGDSPRVPLKDGELRFSYKDRNLVYVDVWDEIVNGCCRDEQDRTIMRLSMEMDDHAIAEKLGRKVRTIQKRKDVIYATYLDRKCKREGLSPKVERAAAVERVSEKANGIEVALGA